MQSILSALLPPLATAAIVIIFVVFILLQRRDLRDRFIGLIGSDDLHRTTKALDDAAQRLSRYFLALTGINASFGIIIGLGLSFIGVPNPILWGIVGAVLRFVPYAGAFIAAAIPLALAAAVDPGWSMVAETALLFVVVEGVMGQGGAAVVRPHHGNVAPRHRCRGWLLDPHMGRARASPVDADHGMSSGFGPACRKSKFHRAASR